MALYAHAVIEVDDHKWDRGDEVPTDLPGLDELRDGGSVSEESYDPAKDKNDPPASIEIDGVRYVQEPTDA